MQYLVQADTGSQMRATLTRHDTGAILVLTDATVLLKVRERGTANVLFSINGQELVIGEYLVGVVTFLFDVNLATLAGHYEGEIEVTYNGGSVESVYELVRFQIRPEF